jgi:hypothetical protein
LDRGPDQGCGSCRGITSERDRKRTKAQGANPGPFRVCVNRKTAKRSGVFHVPAAIGVSAQANDFHSRCDLFAVGAAILRFPGRNARTGRISTFPGVRHSSPPLICSDVMPSGSTTKLDAEIRRQLETKGKWRNCTCPDRVEFCRYTESSCRGWVRVVAADENRRAGRMRYSKRHV